MDSEDRLGVDVEVDEQGRLTLPESVVDQLGIELPAQVRFENVGDSVVLTPAPSYKRFRGMLTTEKPAHELVEEARAVDKERDEWLDGRYGRGENE